MRVLGLDVGTKRIGIAVSDGLGITAQAVETLVCSTPEEDDNRITELVAKYQVTKLVVGIPYNMNGSEGPQAAKVREVIERLKTKLTLPIDEWDERLSTVAAERVLLQADMSREKRRKVIDKVAAVIILQGYLDSLHHEGSLTR